MGAPGYTTFCENGHIVEIVGHHEISEYDMCEMYGELCERPPCVCGSKEFRQVEEWGDTDYHDNDGDGPVPSAPIDQEELASKEIATVVTESGQRVTGRRVVKMGVYDVSKLFGKGGETRTNDNKESN